MSNLESLANELFLSLFEYFNDVDVIRAFYGLNIRFNELLLSQLRFYHFDFRFISKKDFNWICQKYIPSIIDRIQSLHFSENDHTPEPFNIFLQLIPSFEQFIQLQSLSLNINQIYLVDKVLNSLPNLTYLTISTRCLNLDLNYTNHLINIIWNLSTLICCKLDNVISYGSLVANPTIKSISLRYLIINELICDLIEFTHLCEYTPNLRYLEISIVDSYSTIESSFEFQFLTKFKLFFQGSLNILIKIFQSMPNLKYLIINTQKIIINGYQWEQMIEDYLPNLKIFRFLMKFNLFETNIDELFQSFQTEFWLEKRRWFIEYHWNKNHLISFYSLPYFFNYFIYETNLKFKSTCPENQYYHMYNRVHSLLYDLCITKEISFYSPLNFSNIRSLDIAFPFNEHFWSIIPNLNQLISLKIQRFNNNNKTYDQLQFLLDRSVNLYSLTFQSSFFSPKVFKLKSSTIRKLDLFQCDYWFNDQQCKTLINSLLTKQCEILFIKIKKCSNILQLATKIKQLRILIIQCKDDKYETNENHLIEWLKERLLSTYLIKRDLNKSVIRILTQ